MAIKKIDRTSIQDDDKQEYFDPMWGGVYIGAFDIVTIEWDAEPNADSYNVYFSMFPLYRYKVNRDRITTNQLKFKLPIYPQNMHFYFWVSKVVGGVETFINESGETFYDVSKRNFMEETESPITPSFVFPETDNINSSMKYVITELIPAEVKFVLENDGTTCDVYMRRWGSDSPFGIPCACTDKSDANADFRGSDRCNLCFGTGIVGGYYPPIKMTIRFNMMPAKDFKGTLAGLKVSQTYDGWTVPDPILRVGDMIVRRLDGERYEVKEVKVSAPRDVATRQDIKFDLIHLMDIRRIVSVDTINAALAKTADSRYNPQGRSNF